MTTVKGITISCVSKRHRTEDNRAVVANKLCKSDLFQKYRYSCVFQKQNYQLSDNCTRVWVEKYNFDTNFHVNKIPLRFCQFVSMFQTTSLMYIERN